MTEMIKLLALPVLQSILAARIDEALKEFASDKYMPSFEKAMKEAFIEAVKRIRGDAPRTVQIALEDEFEDCKESLMRELRTLQPAEKKAYIDEKLLETFRNCLLAKKEAFAHVSMECLKALYDRLGSMASDVAGIKEICNALQMKGGLRSYEIRLAVTDTCKIPAIHSRRETVVQEMKNILLTVHSIIIYGTIKSGKSVSSCLLAQAIDGYQTICINLGYKKDLNLAFLLMQYDRNAKILFMIDAVKLTPDEWKAMATLLTSSRSNNWLFIVNTSDSVEARMLDDDCQLGDYQLPLLTQEEVEEMIPDEKRDIWGTVIHTLFSGQPLITNEVCVCLKMKNWELTTDNFKEVLQHPANKVKDKAFRLVNFMMPDTECYRLFNRLVLWNRPITQKVCERLAQVEPAIMNPRRTLMALDGQWISKSNNTYSLSEYVRKSFIPDLLSQERCDCCHVCIEHIKSQPMNVADIMQVIGFYQKCEEYDEAVAFYISVLVKLKDEGYIGQPQVKILLSLWMRVRLDVRISKETALCLRVAQLVLIPNLLDEDREYLLDDIERLLADYQGKAKGLFLQTIIGHSMLNNEFARPAEYLLRLQETEQNGCTVQMEPIHIVALLLNNISVPEEVGRFCDVFVAEGSPHNSILCEGAVMKVGQLYERASEDKKEYVLRHIYDVSNAKQVKMLAIAAAARLIGHYDQKNEVDKMHDFYKESESLCDENMGRILLHYAYGLGLMNHGQREYGLSNLETAALTVEYADAYMEKLYASSLVAKEYGDKGDHTAAFKLLDSIFSSPMYEECFTGWDRDAALGNMAYACWMAGEKGRAAQAVMEIESHLWRNRDKQDDTYKNMSMRLCVLVLFIQSEISGKPVREDFARPDYDALTRVCPNLIGGYDPLRNFTMEYGIYCLAEHFLDEPKALEIIDHMLGFQGTDGKSRGSLLSIMTLAFPLLLKHDRWDDIKYIIVTALSSAKGEGGESWEHSVRLLPNSSLNIITAHRAVCIMQGVQFDDARIFDIMDEIQSVAGGIQEFEEVEKQMLQGDADLSSLKKNENKCIVSLFNFQRMDFAQCLELLWLQAGFLFPFSEHPSGMEFFKKYVDSYIVHLIRNHAQQFCTSESDILKVLDKVGHLKGLDYVKKVIQGLHFYIKDNVRVNISKEIESFLYE